MIKSPFLQRVANFVSSQPRGLKCLGFLVLAFLLLYFYDSSHLPVVPPASIESSSSITIVPVYDLDLPDYSSLYPDDSVPDLSDGGSSFNSSGTDTLVFLHIQKTGGTTLGRRFVDDIVHHKCTKIKHKKRSYCPRPLVKSTSLSAIQPSQSSTWIFSRYSTGWVCGLHADWTELKPCVAPKLNELHGARERNLIYITNLRNATVRFISEWKHIQRGATWRTATLRCGNENHLDLWNRCFPNRTDWSDVTLASFAACPSNLAFNRQTRMLADLELIDCYSHLSNFHNISDDIASKMLESAKRNLSKMRWFGLVEYQMASEVLFEHAFQPLHFGLQFEKWNSTHSSEALDAIPRDLLDEITRLNHLDVALYDFAKKLFFQRYRDLTDQDLSSLMSSSHSANSLQ